MSQDREHLLHGLRALFRSDSTYIDDRRECGVTDRRTALLKRDQRDCYNDITQRSYRMNINAIMVMLICTLANHMGLVSAIEERMGFKILVLDCVKCSVFWTTLTAGLLSRQAVLTSAVMAFVYSYLALWLELLLCQVDSLYLKCYEKIVSNTGADTPAADSSDDDAAGPVS